MNKRVLTVIGLVLLLAGIGAACTDTGDLESRLDAVEEQQAALGQALNASNEATQRAAIVTALKVLSDAALHDLDEMANEQGEVPAGASGAVNSAILAVAAVDWPDELAAAAAELIATLQELHEALASADAAVAGPPATAAHDLYHDFEHDAAAYLGASLGLATEDDRGGEEGDDDHADEEGEQAEEEHRE